MHPKLYIVYLTREGSTSHTYRIFFTSYYDAHKYGDTYVRESKAWNNRIYTYKILTYELTSTNPSI